MCHKSICIVTHSYLRKDGAGPEIGGVQTYVDSLCSVLSTHPVRIDVLQPSILDFEKLLGPRVKVIGVQGGPNRLRNVYKRYYRGKYTLAIFADYLWAHWSNGEKCIAIQHGIHWDGFLTRYKGIKAHLHRLQRTYKNWQWRRQTAEILDKVSQVICVDLNFPNWLRATFPFRRWEEKLTYIPNFGDPISQQELAIKQNRNGDTVQVLIARRFEDYRGIMLIGGIVKEIADGYPQCRFLFAGSGSREKELREMLAGINNCQIQRVPYCQMREKCRESDVAVIPTLYAEGTSLSCIESLCAGSAVIATGVGGLSNIILHNYNGLIVEPTREAVKDGLIRLLEDRELRVKLGLNAYETACECFSRQQWKSKIEAVVLKHLG